MRRGLVVGVALRQAQGERICGIDDVGVRVGKRCWRRNGRFPLLRDGRFANRPYGAFGEWGMRRGLVVGVPAPLDTGFRRYDDGGVRVGKCCWRRNGKFPLLRDGRFANRPYGAFGELVMRQGFVRVPRPVPVPPSISLRANGHRPSGFLPSQE